MSAPRVSVLMTIYNAAPFLRQSIGSLLSQSFTDWELIAVENGSTDGSAAILADYTDPRVRVFPFLKNIGRTPALRNAFDQARGEYVAILDADDVSHPLRLVRQVKFLDDHPGTVLVGSWVEKIDEKGHVLDTLMPPLDPRELRDLLGRVNPVVNSSAMYRRELAARAGGYREEYVFAQDFALILALTQYGEIAVIDDYLCKLRILSGSMTRSGQYDLAFKREELALLKQAGKTLVLSGKARVINLLKVLKCQIGYGLYLCVHGDTVRGLK